MPVFNVVEPDAIIQTNELITGIKCDPLRRANAGGCLSSYFYYTDIQQQIASIVVSLVKDHFFMDGNKRTAFIIYTTLCVLNNLQYIENVQAQVRAFIEIAVTARDIAEYAVLLFS